MKRGERKEIRGGEQIRDRILLERGEKGEKRKEQRVREGKNI